MIGKTLGHYKVGEQLGRGGMGEVYVADDLSLGRKVALKFLPDAFTGDPERMARFEREAKVLASLNHPNIAGIYGLEQAEGKRFIVMELVEGETLAQRLSKGPLPIDEALGICKQIDEGLEAAHERGVIHRDLKPANVMITEGDKVKILDFGLAKALSEETQSIDSSHSPTLTEAMTRPGVILGTAAYMSPEQAKGKAVDKRADIWAFGCILYECLTGKRAFEGETVTETLAAVLTKEPDCDKVPAKMLFLLRNCLEKNPSHRLRDIGDAWRLLEAAPEFTHAKRPWLAWCLAIICFIGALVVGLYHLLRSPVEINEMRLEVVTPPTSDPTSLAISPDGHLLVFVATTERQQRLWIRPLNAVSAHPLEGTEGATNPFWSSDSRSVGFFAESKLKRIDISGGQRQVLGSVASPFGGTWNGEGIIVYAQAFFGPLSRIPAKGGIPEAITRLDPPRQTGHWFPQFLPDGRRFLFFAEGSDRGIYLGSLDSTKTRRLMEAESSASYAPPGYLLFMRQGTLYAQRFDLSREDLVGDPLAVADSIAVDPRYMGGFSLSETGMLAFRTGAGISRRRLAWFNRAGKEVGTLGVPDGNNLLNPNLSPDGRYVAVDRTVQGNRDIYVTDIARGVFRRLTFDAQEDFYPVWSPDGSRIAFCSRRKQGPIDLYEKASSGAGQEVLLRESSLHKFPYDWSLDGRFLLYMQIDTKTGRDLWALPLSGDRREFSVVNTTFNESNGQFSPDARWVAYQTNESGQDEIYVRAFPHPGGSKWQVSTGGGITPRWSHDGKELFYIAPDGKLIVSPIQGSGQTPEVGASSPLFQTQIVNYPIPQSAQYAVSADGQRFLINITAVESAASSINVVTNWTHALKK